MSYNSGTIINSVNATEVLLTQIKSQLTAHSSWQFVESYADTSQYQHDVYRNLAAGNTIGQDFYIIFSRPKSGSTGFYTWGAEGYNATTHQATRWLATQPFNSGQLFPVASDGSYSLTPYTLRDTTSMFTNAYCSMSNSVSDYWMIITANTFTVCTRPTSSGTFMAHVGAFDSLVYNAATNDPFPLQVWGSYNLSNGAPAVTTRHPMRAGTSTYGAFGHGWQGWTLASGGTNQSGKTPQGDPFQGGAALASRYAIYTYAAWNGSETTARVAGVVRGLVKPEILLINSDSSVTAGDTVTVGAHTYVNLNGNVWGDTNAN